MYNIICISFCTKDGPNHFGHELTNELMIYRQITSGVPYTTVNSAVTKPK